MSDSDFPDPGSGFVVTHFLVVSDQDRSRDFYHSVFGAKVLVERDPVIMKIANSWLILNVGGGPTDPGICQNPRNPLDDRPPVVTFEKPGRDTKATSVEELLTLAKAEDDYGVISLDLYYSVNGGEEKKVDLQKLRGESAKTLSGAHTFFLEEFGLQPGDLISYYAKARDAKNETTSDIYFMEVHAPRLAQSAQPGQFLIVRVDENSERIPLTIADFDREKGTIVIVTQALGVSTRKIAAMNEGDCFANFAGPLGVPSELIHMSPDELKNLKVLFVAGGVGAAPIYPQVKFMADNGAKADVVLGARTSDLFIFRNKLSAVSNRLLLATNDGSEGVKGLVTDAIAQLVETEGKKYDMVVTIGPMIMMRAVADYTRKLGLKTIASLNTLMVDGTGMCGACRVSVGGKTRFTCVDGPEFDAHQVDFDEAMRRQGMYKREEKKKLDDDHECKIGIGR